MKRRNFLLNMGASIASIAMLPLAGCRTRSRSQAKEDEEFVEIHDLILERHDSPKYDYKRKILFADEILANEPVVLKHEEKTHEHQLVIEPHHFERIKRGETVVITTGIPTDPDYKSPHTHSYRVSIDNYVERRGGALKVPLGPEPEALEGVVPMTPDQFFKINA